MLVGVAYLSLCCASLGQSTYLGVYVAHYKFVQLDQKPSLVQLCRNLGVRKFWSSTSKYLELGNQRSDLIKDKRNKYRGLECTINTTYQQHS